jgi:hypothetical protein
MFVPVRRRTLLTSLLASVIPARGDEALIKPAPRRDILCLGTSLTACPCIDPTYPKALGIETRLDVLNKGWAGRTSWSIATLWGAIGDPITESVTIPSLGSTPINPSWEALQGCADARLHGIAGVVQRDTGGYTFRRTGEGPSVGVVAGEKVWITGNLNGSPLPPTNRTLILECSRNNELNEPPDVIVGHITALIKKYAKGSPAPVLVIGEPMGTADSDAEILIRQARNSRLRAAFPTAYVPAFEWLLTEKCRRYLGLTWTPADLADIARGVTPGALRADELHLNAQGNRALAHRLALALTARGW